MTSPPLSELLRRTTALRILACQLVGEGSADDIVQDAAVQTMTSPPRRPGAATHWLAQVVRHLASKHRRAERTRQRHEAEAARVDIALDQSAESVDTRRQLKDAIRSLPDPYRETILARYLWEQTPTEIAESTETPVATVKTRLQRGLGLLRERLAEGCDDWRGALIGAFAIEPAGSLIAPSAKSPFPFGTTMKIAILAAVLIPVGVGLWDTFAGSAPPANAVASDPDRARVAATIARPDAGASRRPGDATAVAPDVAAGSPTAPTAAAGGGAAAGEPDPAATAHAQGPPPAIAAPAPEDGAALPIDRPLWRLDAVGPKAFRQAFARTQLGALCASENGALLWQPLLAPAERIWRQWHGAADDAEFAAARRRVLDYTGRIRALWMVQPGEGAERDRAFGVFTLERDGATDLTELAGDVTRALRSLMPGEASRERVAGHDLRVLGDTSAGYVTLPILVDGSLVAFFGEAASLDQTVRRCLRALAEETEPPTAPVSLHIGLTQLQGLAEMRANPPLVKALGLASLRSLDATLRPNGPHVQLEIDVDVGDGHRGLVDAFLPPTDTLPNFLARVPHEATPWLTVPFRPDELFRVAVTAAADYDALGAPDASADLRADAQNELGLDLGAELLDHLGGEIMVLGDLWEPSDPKTFRDGGDPPLGACIAMPVADTAAFSAGFDKLLQHFKRVVRKYETREIHGVKITRMGSLFLTGVHMAIGANLVAIAFGDEGVAQLEALVTGTSGVAPRALPAAVEHVQSLAPPHWNGVGLADLRALCSGQLGLVLEMLDARLPRPMRLGSSIDDTQAWLDRLVPLIVEHKLDHLVTMTGHDGQHWRLRVLW
ncbi:MAG: sigma-70 family RNA polymerase sigma factor [Planctomycetota bacterium]